MIDLEKHSTHARAHERPTHGRGQPAASRYGRLWAVGALLLAAGCEQTDVPQREPSEHTTQWAAPEAPTSPVIRKKRAAGTLCPSDTTTLYVSGDGHALVMKIGKSLDAIDGRSEIEADCKLTLDLEIPSGMALGNPTLQYRLAGYGPIELSAQYAFSDQAPVRGGALVVNPEADGAAQDRPHNLWSPTCGGAKGSQRLPLSFDIHMRIPIGATLDGVTIDVDLGAPQFAEWRSCDGAAPVSTGVRKGEACTLSDRPCGKDLVCELMDDPRLPAAKLNNGRCVVKGELAAGPSRDQGPCGGVNDLLCGAGLTCQYSSEEHAARDALGRCVAARGGEGEPCAGYPDVPCKTGYTCRAAAAGDRIKFCERIGSDEGGVCEASADCDAGFDCIAIKGQIKRCTAHVAARDEACGPGVAVCKSGDTCDEQLKRCVAAGDEEALCKTRDDCLPHLDCKAGRCTDPRVGLGESCRSSADCKPSFVCSTSESTGDWRCAVQGTARPGEACVNQNDCRQGLSCYQMKCSRPWDGSLDANCQNDAQCNDELVCVDNACSNPS